MTYDYRARKIVAVVSDRIDVVVALNVVGHLAVALGARADRELMGRPTLIDGSAIPHLGIARYPLLIKKARPTQVRQAIEAARSTPDVVAIDYPRQMLETGHDDELAAALAATDEPAIDYLGVVLYGPRDAVDAISCKYSLWR